MRGLTLLRAIDDAAGPPPCDVRPFKRSLARRPFSLWNDGQPYRTKRCPLIQDERADIADGAAHRGGAGAPHLGLQRNLDRANQSRRGVSPGAHAISSCSARHTPLSPSWTEHFSPACFEVHAAKASGGGARGGSATAISAALKTQVARAKGIVFQVIEDCIGSPWSEGTRAETAAPVCSGGDPRM